jgi:phage shock protein PspC (stress-responsive transcriptional regulator)
MRKLDQSIITMLLILFIIVALLGATLAAYGTYKIVFSTEESKCINSM